MTDSFTVLPGRVDLGLVLLCDHASNRLPPGYGTLGLCEADLRRHIAYDIGAEEVVRGLSAALGAPALLSRYSRLLIDLNRGTDDPTLIMQLSDGAIVPGNRRIDADERAQRIARFYEPYHRAADAMIDAGLAAGVPPMLLSIHSFTPVWRGTVRPWHAAVLWDTDPRLAGPLIDALRSDTSIVVGDNEPYTGKLRGDCLWQHGTQRGLAHAIVEIRQDLIESQAGQQAWVDRLAGILREIAARPELTRDLARVAYYGSHTDMPT